MHDEDDVTLRPFEDGDATALWELKRAFELELGGADEQKRAAYEGKLTGDYRRRYREWVKRCVADGPRCVTVADPDGTVSLRTDAKSSLAGYVFVLPERLGMVWDAAVVNELFVAAPYRGTGLADDLMDTAVAVARDQDPPLSRLVLDVDRENDRARAFYHRHGFEHWGEMVARQL